MYVRYIRDIRLTFGTYKVHQAHFWYTLGTPDTYEAPRNILDYMYRQCMCQVKTDILEKMRYI